MATIIVAGFIIPWIFGIYLILKDIRTVLTIGPMAFVGARLVNDIGYTYNFWGTIADKHLPIELLSSIPVELGLYPVMACFLIHFIKRNPRRSFTFIMLFSIFATVFEWGVVLMGVVIYGNHWNIGWTFVSYLLSFVIVYGFHILLVKKQIYEGPWLRNV